MTDLKIYSVTLVFSPPGPVHASLVIAGDEATASAIATHHVMTNEPLVTAPLLTVMALPVDPDMLRGMLRTIEGRGPGEVVSLVPKHVRVENDTAGQEYGPPLHTAPYSAIEAWRAAEILRKHEPDLDAAHMWNRQPPLHYWGEEYGPPWPGGAA